MCFSFELLVYRYVIDETMVMSTNSCSADYDLVYTEVPNTCSLASVPGAPLSCSGCDRRAAAEADAIGEHQLRLTRSGCRSSS